MAKPLRPFVRGGGYYPSKKWIPLVRNGGYTTQNGGETEPVWATVSGAIASFTTPFAYPLKKLVAQINPAQDLHGQDAPYPPEGKGNLFPFQDKTATSNGVTAVFSGNHIKVTGTGTASGGRLNLVSANFSLKAGTYYYKRFNVNTVGQQTALYVQNGINIISPINDGTFTLDADSSTINIGMNVESGKTYNYEFDIMLVSGSTEPSAFYPYSNLCPISGWTGLEGHRTGVNILECYGQTQAGVTGSKNADGTFHIEGTATVSSYPVNFKMMTLKAGTYVYSVSELPSGVSAQFGLNGSWAGVITQGKTFTVADGTVLTGYVNVPSGATVNADIAIQLEVGSVASGTIEPYTSLPISVSFGQTVYGGSDEVISGNGTSTLGMITLDGVTNKVDGVYGNGVFYTKVIADMYDDTSGAKQYTANVKCDILKGTSWNLIPSTPFGISQNTGKRFALNIPNISTVAEANTWLASNTPHVLYELSEPTTFTHTGQSVDTLVGQNNIWTTTGDVEVTYRIE